MTDKINPILDAMSEIDDNIVTNTKKRRKHPLFIAAVAAAALAMIMGCAVVYDYSSSVKINGEPVFELDYHVQENLHLLTHEELLEMGAEQHSLSASAGSYYKIKALPSEVFAAYNLTPLINDNFIERDSTVWIDYIWLTKPEDLRQLRITYSLTDKESGIGVRLKMNCAVTDKTNTGEWFDESDNLTVLELNNGTKAMLKDFEDSGWHGIFSYDGIVYNIDSDYIGLDDMKQILADLGVL